MMERIEVQLNQPDLFDRAVHGDDQIRALPSGTYLQIITKDGGMASGAACAVVTFTTEGPDGKIYRAQFSTSVRLLKASLAILDGRYDDDGMPRRLV